MLRRLLVTAGAGLVLAFAASSARADTTYYIGSLADDSGVANNCTDPRNRDCELRYAISDASSGDTIQFASGLSGTLTLQHGPLTIHIPLTITGPGDGSIAIDGGNTTRIVDNDGSGLTLSGLTLENGHDTDVGGGVFNAGGATATLTDDTLSNDTTGLGVNDGGGGVYNFGTITVTGSTFSGGSAYVGAGMWNDGTATLSGNTFSGGFAAAGGGFSNRGTLTSTGNTFTGDTVLYGGGGIHNSGTATSTNDTLVGEKSTDPSSTGAGIYNAAGSTLTVVNDTLSGDTADQVGGAGVYNEGTATMSNSILDGTSCVGFLDGGHNVQSGNFCGWGPTDVSNSSTIDLAESLAANGSSGPETLAIGSDSSAYGEVPAASCTVATDERGAPRPDAADSDCDAGAYEAQISTVSFDANGGSGTMTAQAEQFPTNLTSNTLTYVGHHFAGWNTAADGSGTAYTDGASYAFGSDVTLYAQWTLDTYTVSYSDNGSTGGSAPTDPASPHGYGTTVTVLGNTGNLAKTGFTFAGWNTAADGTGTAYAGAATFPQPASNVTLFAQWTVNSYTVSYSGNGSSGGSPPTDSGSPHVFGTTVTVLGNTGNLAKTGYTFAGWNTAANGAGTSYAAGGTFPQPAANVTLYAVWAINNHVVTFMANGGSGSMAAETHNLPAALTTNGFTRTGYRFAGWNTLANGTGIAYANGAVYPFTASVTLYAHWLHQQTITFAALANKTLAQSPLTVSATATSGLAITFTSTTLAVCTASGTHGATIALLKSGTCTIRAAQAGNAGYDPAPSVDRSFTVSKAAQTITFAPLANKTLAQSPLTLSATATSGLAVIFTSTTPAVCTASGTHGATITLHKKGTCTIQAAQAGNTIYNAATAVTRSFTVS
jgi:uncharacterized repeat protein (TIGR02543 family)